MSTKYYNKDGEVEGEFYDSVMEIPWFQDVLAVSIRDLEAQYGFDPESTPSWYRGYRKDLDTLAQVSDPG